jgi:hypothetical protein
MSTQDAENVRSSNIGAARITGAVHTHVSALAGPYPCKPCRICGEQPETGDRVYATDDGITCTACWTPLIDGQADGS